MVAAIALEKRVPVDIIHIDEVLDVDAIVVYLEQRLALRLVVAVLVDEVVRAQRLHVLAFGGFFVAGISTAYHSRLFLEPSTCRHACPRSTGSLRSHPGPRLRRSPRFVQQMEQHALLRLIHIIQLFGASDLAVGVHLALVHAVHLHLTPPNRSYCSTLPFVWQRCRNKWDEQGP